MKQDQYGQFIAEFAGYVRAIAIRLAPRPDMADDLGQEAFLIALSKSEAFDATRDIKPWLAGITRNVCRRAWEKMIKENAIRRDDLAEFIEEMADHAPVHEDLPRKEALRMCLDLLPERARSLLNLRYNLTLRSDAIAEKMSTSADAARMALMRIRQQLKTCIKQRLGSEGAR